MLAAEHRAYPLALRLVGEGRVKVVGERTEIAGVSGAAVDPAQSRPTTNARERHRGKLGAILAFWIAVGLIQTFNWGSGIPKAIVMALLLAAAPLVIARRATRRAARARLQRAAGIAFWIALALNLVYFGVRIIAPHIIDIGTTTLAAGQAMLHGQNPYTLPLDQGPESAGFTGYKYLPMMILDYLPLGAPFGQRGVLLTNLLLLLAVLVADEAHRRHQARAAPAADAAAGRGANLRQGRDRSCRRRCRCLLALALTGRSSFWCGVCVGLSIATKLAARRRAAPGADPGDSGATCSPPASSSDPADRALLPRRAGRPSGATSCSSTSRACPTARPGSTRCPPRVATAAHLVFARGAARGRRSGLAPRAAGHRPRRARARCWGSARSSPGRARITITSSGGCRFTPCCWLWRWQRQGPRRLYQRGRIRF